MMTGHRQSDAKTVEIWLKLAVRAVMNIGEGGRTHRDHQRSDHPPWDNPMSKVPYAGARHGQGSAQPRTVRPQMDPPSQALLRPIANGPELEVQTLIWGSYHYEN